MNSLINLSENVKISAPFEHEITNMAKRKKGSEILANVYGRTSLPDRDRKAFRLRLCGKKLVYVDNPAGGDPILISALRCRLRLCPSCSWKRAWQVFENVHSIITHRDFSDKRFIFLTLTVKNCCGKKLESEISRLLSAWNKLTISKRHFGFVRSFAGTFRSLEVTYNKLTGSYHPHLHVLAAVEPGYFRKSNGDYIDQQKLRELWKNACGLDYLPQCRIQRVRGTTRKQVAEVAKYTVKPSDYLSRPAVVETLDTALKRKRLIGYGGLFREVRDLLDLPDEDDLPASEFPRPTVQELLQNPYIRKIMLQWTLGAYRISVLRPSNDPAEWLEPGRLAALALRGAGG
jgi:plasmid rolling circle replication initiator protein Rep